MEAGSCLGDTLITPSSFLCLGMQGKQFSPLFAVWDSCTAPVLTIRYNYTAFSRSSFTEVYALHCLLVFSLQTYCTQVLTVYLNMFVGHTETCHLNNTGSHVKISLRWERKQSPKSRSRVLYRVNSRRNTPRHIGVQLTEIKDQEKILKATREKQ